MLFRFIRCCCHLDFQLGIESYCGDSFMTDAYVELLFYISGILFFGAFFLVIICWPNIYKYFKGDE